MSENETKNNLQTIRKSFDIVHLLMENGPTRLSEIADELDMAESTAHRYLDTLYNLRYVSRSGKRYQIGLRFARVGTAARTRDPNYRKMRPYVQKLAAETEERAHFITEDHGLGVYLYQSTGSNAVKVGANIGRQVNLHCSAAGKVILSNYSRERVNEILDMWGMPANTEYTITDRDALFSELDTVRNRGYAFNREEAVEGVHVVSAPVKPGDTVIGALCIAGPSRRLTGDRFEEELPEMLLSTANEIELKIEYNSSDQVAEHLIE